jgi:putative ABC transport system substrate-binding protein
VNRLSIADFRSWISATRRKQVFRFALAALLLMLSGPVGAQQREKIAKIGEFDLRGDSTLGTGRKLFRPLRELGYIEGKNVIYETRSAEGNLDRFSVLAEELVRLKVDVLLTTSPDETLAAKNATKTIPIVFFAQSDPAASRLVDSLARPGGNITGVSTIAMELSGKRLELLKETIPTLSRVAVMWNPKMSGQSWKESQLAARELGLQLHSMEVTSADKFESAFKEEGGKCRYCRNAEPTNLFHESKAGRCPGNEESTPGNISARRLCRQRRLNVLRSRPG